ncbi:nicotinamidase-related amidase [Ureibacillus xyleni]|uniref:Nicotinamidase-related amidase n=1 Tax=Ureibacillus xyleni TaxID=614648 RepID=A0A285TPK9_9BACL|nr:cysteine hydrolase family protein [Ureibacillus xyleni]SOC25023.1 nicotinamidase-related amidase [Ureibacillus xyleni]
MATALLLVDIQNDYFPNGKMRLTNPEKAAQNAAKLLAHFRQTGKPIFHVQHIATGENIPFFHPNTEGVEIHEYVRPLEGEKVIVKHYPNSFFNTDLHDQLQEQGVKELIICGMMSHMCIDATVRSAAEHGYICQVMEDACATTTLQIEDKVIPAEHVHYAFMAALNGMYATVKTTESFLK